MSDFDIRAITLGENVTAEDVRDDLEFLDDWEDRYRMVIDMGKAMPDLPDAGGADWMTEPLLTTEEEAAATVWEDGPDGREAALFQPEVDGIELLLLVPADGAAAAAPSGLS